MTTNKKPREVAIIDFETDPFKFDRAPKPFACGVLWRDCYAEFWGPDCWQQAVDYLHSIKVPLLVYAHNGGKFDFFFMLRALENPIKLINSRIVAAKLGIHELRDSWAIMPFGLAKYSKTEIDYNKFEPELRELHREEISRYLHDDCCDLMELCAAFNKRFGPMLTVAGTAMKELVKIHPQENLGESHDKRFRPYYFGGRVECFESGILHGDFKVFDVNSMYPHCMSAFSHPLGAKYVVPEVLAFDAAGWVEGFPGCMYFAEVEGDNLGALPQRSGDRNRGLRFDVHRGIFRTTSHELRAAIAIGKFALRKVHQILIPCRTQRFDTFVKTFTDEKAAAKKAGDKINELFAKYIVNSAYGKFGQNPEDFKDYFIQIRGVHSWPGEEWDLEQSAEHWCIWSKEAPAKRYFDVAIAASVTSAARAVLMRGIAGAKRPIYCDTDSIICEGVTDVRIDEYELGAWKQEARAERAAVAGKKLYALFDAGGKAVKWASKGTKLQPEQVEKVARGGEVRWQSDAPNFSLTGAVKFVERVSRKTA